MRWRGPLPFVYLLSKANCGFAFTATLPSCVNVYPTHKRFGFSGNSDRPLAKDTQRNGVGVGHTRNRLSRNDEVEKSERQPSLKKAMDKDEICAGSKIRKAKLGAKEELHGNEKGIRKAKKRKKTSPVEPIYWRNHADEFTLCNEVIDETTVNGTEDSNSHVARRKGIKFTVRGKPRPLQRHRTSKGFMYNPSSKAQKSFRDVVSSMLETNNSDAKEPFFSEEDFIAVYILFHLARPKAHFIGRKPGPGRLRSNSPVWLHHTRVDVDNLAKFVLDSLNELMYEDDRQVVLLQASKILHNEGECDGAIEVTMNNILEGDYDDFLGKAKHA
mmetsp:Transcript_22761/g.67291  ORF Transcript_22761/g.67291 Transcript_22761/m.67291 type:complete len:329 (-) Transcript_22761:12-998(-)